MSWARVPAWLSRRVPTNRPASEVEAWTDLLCRWQEGENPGPRELMRAWSWGAGRTMAFVERARAWAAEHGGAAPQRNKSERQRNTLTREPERTDTDNDVIVDEERNESEREAEQERNVSRARDLLMAEREAEIMGGDSDAATATSPVDLPAALDGDGRLLAPLLSAGLVTVEQVEAQTIQALRMLPGVGAKRALAIADALARHGHPLRTEAPPKRTKEVERPGLRDLSDRWCAAYERVTGSPYRWTQGGPTSDAKAIATIYDAVGWTDPPTAEVASATRATVIGYLQARQRRGRVPTLADLARNLAEFRQAPELVAAASEPLRFRSSDEARSDAKMALIHSLLTPATTRITDDA